MICSNSGYYILLLVKICLFILPEIQLAQNGNTSSYDSANTQNINNIITLNQNYETSFDIPKILNKGDILKCNCNGIYIVNSLRFNFYEKLRSLLLDSQELYGFEIIENYEKLLGNDIRDYRKLQINCDSTSSLLEYTLASSDSALNVAEQSLLESHLKIKDLNRNLYEAEVLLENERKSNFLENLLFSLGSLGIGIIVALLIQ